VGGVLAERAVGVAAAVAVVAVVGGGDSKDPPGDENFAVRAFRRRLAVDFSLHDRIDFY
jgi:hypothetical protein